MAKCSLKITARVWDLLWTWIHMPHNEDKKILEFCFLFAGGLTSAFWNKASAGAAGRQDNTCLHLLSAFSLRPVTPSKFNGFRTLTRKPTFHITLIQHSLSNTTCTLISSTNRICDLRQMEFLKTLETHLYHSWI